MVSVEEFNRRRGIKPKKPEPLTEEQRGEQERAGQEFVRAREKEAAKISPQGANRTDIEEAARIVSERLKRETPGQALADTAASSFTSKAAQEIKAETAQEKFQTIGQGKEEGVIKRTAEKIRLFGKKTRESGKSILGAGGGEVIEIAGEVIPQIADQPFTETIGDIGDAIGTISSGLTGGSRKPIELSTAEQSFNDEAQAIEKSIKQVAVGEKSPVEVEFKIKILKSILGRVEESQKGFGKLNPRYFSTRGKEVEEEIIRFNDVVIQFENELLNARIQARAAQLAEENIQ